MRTEDIEQLRRSMAMIAPGQPAGVTRDEVEELLTELRMVRAELDRLEGGLRALLDGAHESRWQR